MNSSRDYSERRSGIDILKIMSMVLITLIHYFSYSSISESQNLLPLNKIIFTALRTLTAIAVNTFPMITGYLLYNKKSSTLRPFKLWSEGWFYSFVLIFIGLIIGKGIISPLNILYSVFPFFTMHYWYLTAIIIIYLLSPLLNLIIKGISEKNSLKYILIAGIIITVYYVSNPFIISDVYIGHPRGIVWLSFLYILGGYIRQRSIKKENTVARKEKLLWALLAFVTFIIIFLLKYLNLPSVFKNAQLLSDYAFLPFLLTLSVFCLLKDIHIKSYNIKRVITRVAECSFGVYLIQEHVMIRGAYWSFFDANKYTNSLFFIVQLLCAVILIWPFAYVGHFIFKKVFNLFGIKIYNIIIKAVSSLPLLKNKNA
ncbi:MAG: acyltransferase [Clostridia bacterium]|nr:acyltransferase [Clostridia bacterium]